MENVTKVKKCKELSHVRKYYKRGLHYIHKNNTTLSRNNLDKCIRVLGEITLSPSYNCQPILMKEVNQWKKVVWDTLEVNNLLLE